MTRNTAAAARAIGNGSPPGCSTPAKRLLGQARPVAGCRRWSIGAIEEAARRLSAGLPGAGLLENNRYVLDLLLEGTSTGENRRTGEKSPTVRYVDFEQRGNNRFIAVCQCKVRIPGSEHRGRFRNARGFNGDRTMKPTMKPTCAAAILAGAAAMAGAEPPGRFAPTCETPPWPSTWPATGSRARPRRTGLLSGRHPTSAPPRTRTPDQSDHAGRLADRRPGR